MKQSRVQPATLSTKVVPTACKLQLVSENKKATSTHQQFTTQSSTTDNSGTDVPTTCNRKQVDHLSIQLKWTVAIGTKSQNASKKIRLLQKNLRQFILTDLPKKISPTQSRCLNRHSLQLIAILTCSSRAMKMQ